ncbi:MAG TPA: hypothetical protein VMU59_10925 [Caulobacteraceae bacterium]|nr:hypothetical protein [Caulobacteraceae bacterium]
MNAHATFAADAARAPYDPVLDAAGRARALAERQLAMLERLAEAGLDVARAVQREAQALADRALTDQALTDQALTDQAQAGEGASDGPDPDAAAPSTPPPSGRSLQSLAMAYARAARAVRMTVMLQSRVLRDLEAAERQAGLREFDDRARREAARQARKGRVARIVRRVAEACADAEAQGQEGARDVNLDGIERLDEDVFGDVLTRPMGEIVARICDYLGLEPDWSDLAWEAWAEAEAADPRSPFAAPGLAHAGSAVPESVAAPAAAFRASG